MILVVPSYSHIITNCNVSYFILFVVLKSINSGNTGPFLCSFIVSIAHQEYNNYEHVCKAFDLIFICGEKMCLNLSILLASVTAWLWIKLRQSSPA